MKQKRTHIGEQEGLKLAYVTDVVDEAEAKRRIIEMKRCADDIDYFAENYFHVLDKYQNKVTIKMFPKQREFLHKIRDNDRVIAAASRQVAKSTTYSIFILYQIIMRKNYTVLIAGNKGDTAREILGKIKDAYELVPNWIKPGIKVWNESKIVFDNGNVVKSVCTSPDCCRGLSINCLILDELSFVPKEIQDQMWKSSEPTVSSVYGSKIIICSTPNGIGDLFHKIWMDATSGKKTVWVAHKIEWYDVPWRDEAWKERELQSLGSQAAFDQEYGVSFHAISTGDKLITDSKIITLKETAEQSDAVVSILPLNPENVKEPISYTRFFPYEKDHTYVLSLDSAEGTGNDASVAYVLDITKTDDIRLSAKYASSLAIPEKFATAAYYLWLKYGQPKIMIESNACGLAVIENFKTLSRNKDLKVPFNMFSIVNYNRPAGHTGIMSNNQSKSKSMLNLQNIVQSNHYKLILPDDDLYRELPFCEKRSGSGNVTYKALKGHHDDHVLALNWGLFILSPELIEKHFTVEYAIDEDTKQKYPTLVLPLGEDIESYKNSHKTVNDMTVEEAMELASKWRMLGDEARASFILQMVYERETEDTGGNWGRNPYQLDQSMFSEGFRKKFFDGKYSDGYFKPPVSDPNNEDDFDGCLCGWVM